MIRALIIENERDSADQLESLLRKSFVDIEIPGICNTVQKALQGIRSHSPDLVFLDIELDDGETGFDVLKQIAVIDFEIIFTTAFNQYGIQAIKAGALDYLVKPYDKEELIGAVNKFKNNRTKFNHQQIEVLFSNLKNPASQENTIAIASARNPGEFDFIKVSDIIFCQASGDYVEVHMINNADLKNKNVRLVGKSLKECEEILAPYGFIRVHRSHLINRQHILKYKTGNDKYVVLKGEETITISESYEKPFLRAIGKL